MLLQSSKKRLNLGRKQVGNKYMDRNFNRLGLSPVLYMGKFPVKLAKEVYMILAKEFDLETITGQIIDKTPELSKRYDEVIKEIFGRQLEVKESRVSSDYVLTRTSENFRVIFGNHGTAIYKKGKLDLWEFVCMRKQDIELEAVIVDDPTDARGALLNCMHFFPDEILYINGMMVKKNVHPYNQINFSLI